MIWKQKEWLKKLFFFYLTFNSIQKAISVKPEIIVKNSTIDGSLRGAAQSLGIKSITVKKKI
jgi:hypothetical protein